MSRNKGFTILELLGVIAIIAVLAGILVVTATGALRYFGGVTDRHQLDQLGTAIEVYKTKFGEYPPDGTDIDAIRKHILKRWPELLKNGTALQSCIQLVPGGGGENSPPPELSLSFWLCGDEFLPFGTPERFAGSFIELKRGFEKESEFGTEKRGVNWNIHENCLCDSKGYPVIYFRGGVLRNGESLYNGKSVTLNIGGAPVSVVPDADSDGRFYAADTFQLILPGADGDYTKINDNVTSFTAGATRDSESP